MIRFGYYQYTPQQLRRTLIFMAVFCFLGWLWVLLEVRHAVVANQLTQTSQTTAGQVTRTYFKSDKSGYAVDYTYMVEGQQLAGSGDETSQGAVGITVYYLPALPGFSSTDPKATMSEAVRTLGFWSITILGITAVMISGFITLNKATR